MKWFVWCITEKYEHWRFEEFETEKEVIEFLNGQAGNSEFKYTVVEGNEIKFKAVDLVTAYERAD